MKCPYCGAEESKVIDSRPTEDNERIRRRRECLNCHMRFTTYEVVETVPLVVIKKDNSREPFDRQKLFNAMLRACAKRPVSYETLEHRAVPVQLLRPRDPQCAHRRADHGGTEKDRRGGLYPLRFGLPPVCGRGKFP